MLDMPEGGQEDRYGWTVRGKEAKKKVAIVGRDKSCLVSWDKSRNLDFIISAKENS